MPTRKLTDPLIRALPKPEKRTEHFDALVKGLALRVTPTGHKSFVYRYRYGDSVKRYTIGTFSKVALTDARAKARELARMVSDGLDPMMEKRRTRARTDLTFVDLVDRYREIHFPALRPTTRYNYLRQIETELLPAFGDFLVSELTRADVQNLLDSIVRDRGVKTMANRVRACLSSILAFGVRHGYLETNVADRTARFGVGRGGRDRYYSEAEIRALWGAFDAEEPVAGALLKTLLLLGQRKGETSRMRWADISLDHTWTIPAQDAKANRTHVVPLSPQALKVIESMREVTGGSPYVFASPVKPDQPIRGELSRPVERIRESSGVVDFRPHDLRRTVSTYMAGSGVDRTTLGKLLNHKGLAGDGVVTAIYDRWQRLPEIRDAVDRWGERLMEIVHE